MYCKAVLCTNRISNKPSFCSAALQEIIYNDNGYCKVYVGQREKGYAMGHDQQQT